MQMDFCGLRSVCANQLLSSSQIHGHLLSFSSRLKHHPPPPKTNLRFFNNQHLQVKKCFSRSTKVQRPMSTALQMLINHHNVVSQWLVLYLQYEIRPTRYQLECSGQVAYMETHPYHYPHWHISLSVLIFNFNFLNPSQLKHTNPKKVHRTQIGTSKIGYELAKTGCYVNLVKL